MRAHKGVEGGGRKGVGSVGEGERGAGREGRAASATAAAGRFLGKKCSEGETCFGHGQLVLLASSRQANERRLYALYGGHGQAGVADVVVTGRCGWDGGHGQ
eukprot:355627-Chlamydomonas_euryale.AAC.26